jgi:septum site-determining protein MinD
MQYRIIVSSSKGGVGKSTTSALLAVSLAARGKRVLLLDLDLGTRCLDMFFGVEDATVCDFGDAYMGRVEPRRSIVFLDAGAEGKVYFVASSVSLRADEIDKDRLCSTVTALADEIDAEYVICDTAGSVIPTLLAGWANLGLICSTQMPAAIRGAEATGDRLREAGLSTLRLVVTSFDYREAKAGTRSGLLGLIDGSSLRAIGVVPFDRVLMVSQEHGLLPLDNTPAITAYNNIAARLCGEERKLFSGIGRMKGKKAL